MKLKEFQIRSTGPLKQVKKSKNPYDNIQDDEDIRKKELSISNPLRL